MANNCERRAANFVSGSRAEIDAVLKDVGVDGPLCGNCGRRGLHILALHSRNQLLEYLLVERGADPNVTDKKGRTPLHYASGRLTMVCKKTVLLLLEHGAKAAVLDDANQAPIDRALLVESTETAEILLQAEPDWSVRHFGSRDSDGRTLMHACVERELNESVLFLLRHSVSLYDSDFKEIRPLDLLLESNNALLLHRIFQFKLVRIFRRPDDVKNACPDREEPQQTGSPKAQPCLVRDVFEMLKMIDNTGRSFLLIIQELRRLGLIQRHHTSETVRQAFSIKALEDCINEQNLKKFLELMRQMPEFCLSRKLMEGESGQKFMELFIKKAYIDENFDLMQVLMHVMGDVTPVDITQRIERNYLFTLYKECEENGQGVWTYVREQLDFIDEASFWRSLQAFLAKLTGIETAEPDVRLCQVNQFRIFLNPIRTYIVYTVVTGKYQRSFLNLCMRQFDTIPLGLYAVKVLRSLCQLSIITTGVREGLEERADSMEQLLKAALQEVFINDRSRRKTVTCDFIRYKLTPFGNHSVVSLAAVAKCGNFLSLACCQDALDKDWFGDYFESIGPDKMRTPACALNRQLLIAVGLLPLLNVLTFYAVVKLDRRRQEQRRERRLGAAAAAAAENKELWMKHRRHQKEERLRRQNVDTVTETEAENQQHKQEEKVFKPIDDEEVSDDEAGNEEDPPSISGSRGNLGSHRHPHHHRDHRHSAESGGGGSGGRVNSRILDDRSANNALEELLDELDHCEDTCNNNWSDVRRAVVRLCQFLCSPSVKFQYHLLSHLVLLALLTGTVLFHFHSRLNRLDTVIAVWFVGLVVEEVIECRNCKSVLVYLGDMWNVMDLASIGLFYLGFFAKLGLDLTTGEEVERLSCVPDFVDSRYYWIRVLYCICLFLLYCRLLFYAVIFKAIGPKIRMICEMLVTDLLPFLLVLGIFMAAFGVSLQSLLYPNGFFQLKAAPVADGNTTCQDLHNSRWAMQRVWINLIEKAFYITVGEFFVEELKGLACEEGGCPHEIGRILVPTALNFLFILVTNVLLLNLLIALFSKTVDQIHGNSTSVWYYSRHYTVEEFQRRLALPPPLNILQAGGLLLRHLRAPRFLRNTRLARHRATVLRRLRGARKESIVLKFVYFLAVQAVALRPKRAELYLGLVKANRARNFTETAEAVQPSSNSSGDTKQQQPQLHRVEQRLTSLDQQVQELRHLMEQILKMQQQQQHQSSPTLPQVPPPNYQLQVQPPSGSSDDEAAVSSNRNSIGSHFQSALDYPG